MKTISMQPMPADKMFNSETLEESLQKRILWGEPELLDMEYKYISYRFKKLLPQVTNGACAAAVTPLDIKVHGYAMMPAAHFVCAVASGAPHMETLCLLAGVKEPTGMAMTLAWHGLRQSQLQQQGTTEHTNGCAYGLIPPDELLELQPRIYVKYGHAPNGWFIDVEYWQGDRDEVYMKERTTFQNAKYGSPEASGRLTEVKNVEVDRSGDEWQFTRYSQEIGAPDELFVSYNNKKLGARCAARSGQRHLNAPTGVAIWVAAFFDYGTDTYGRKLCCTVRYYEDFTIGVWRSDEEGVRDTPVVLVYYRHYKLHQQSQWFEAAMRRLEKRFFYTLKERMEHRRGDHLPGGAQHEAAKDEMDELQAPDGPGAKVARLHGSGRVTPVGQQGQQP